jgi:diacylglycerol kinase family enzyme
MFTPDAIATDGLFDYVGLAPAHPGHTVALAARLVTRRLAGAGHIVEGQATEITIETPGLAMQLDGDYVCETPVRIWLDPRALTVSVPAGDLPAVLRGGIDELVD